ncbi:hypothetical protein GF359_07670 [candidate division WOR-3 bacterium]|uniref:Uncharacterized protein n=1 Tax=candidate division WOR-3 bacterium TaxID=2052148 RepID=A0A9D5KAB8_UNCW3|nr:hypothetical protein [candidate division WOR-3 bacterium]MBD3365079.1 hypothetical protein [candidate division WOR-3 bacterium]
MKKALMAVMVVALAIGFVGCDIIGGAKSPYYPLAEGNTWDYDVSMTTTVDDSVTLDSSWTTKTEVVGKTELDDGTKVWEVKNEDATSFVEVDKDWVYTYETKADTTEWYKWPNEPKVGDTWDMVIQIDDTTSSTTTYEVVEEGVEANTYADCLKVQVTPEGTDMFDEYENFMYWAKDVGNVKTTCKTVIKTVILDDTMTTTTETESNLNTFTEG